MNRVNNQKAWTCELVSELNWPCGHILVVSETVSFNKGKGVSMNIRLSL